MTLDSWFFDGIVFGLLRTAKSPYDFHTFEYGIYFYYSLVSNNCTTEL